MLNRYKAADDGAEILQMLQDKMKVFVGAKNPFEIDVAKFDMKDVPQARAPRRWRWRFGYRHGRVTTPT